MIKTHNLNSSFISTASYNRSKRILQIEFRNGSTYQYKNISKYMYYKFLNAPSKGNFFEEKIRGSDGYKVLQRKNNALR